MINMSHDAARALLKRMEIPLRVHEIVARKAINSHQDAPRRLRALRAWAICDREDRAKKSKPSKSKPSKKNKE